MSILNDDDKKRVQEAIQKAITEGKAAIERQKQFETEQEKQRVEKQREYEANCRLLAKLWLEQTLPGEIEKLTAEGKSSMLIGSDVIGETRGEACKEAGITISSYVRRTTRIRSDGEYEDGDGWQTDYTVHW